MATQRKLGRTADQRKALLRNQVTNLIWYGRIETTEARAKEVRSIADKIITLAIREYDKTVDVQKKFHNDKGQIVEVTVTNDLPEKLHARRLMMAYLYDLKEIKKDDNAIWYYIQAPASIMRYIVEKGSIAIDGISLTVAKVTEDTFAVSIIPHTAAETTLSERKTGDKVNLENDIVGKYVEKLTQPYTGGAGGSGQSGLTMEKLISAGF